MNDAENPSESEKSDESKEKDPSSIDEEEEKTQVSTAPQIDREEDNEFEPLSADRTKDPMVQEEVLDTLDDEDYGHFIEELRRVIHDYEPDEPGMQARFARTINFLNQKKVALKKEEFLALQGPMDKKDVLTKLSDLLAIREDSLVNKNKYGSSKFNLVMKMAKAREELASKKKNIPPLVSTVERKEREKSEKDKAEKDKAEKDKAEKDKAEKNKSESEESGSDNSESKDAESERSVKN